MTHAERIGDHDDGEWFPVSKYNEVNQTERWAIRTNGVVLQVFSSESDRKKWLASCTPLFREYPVSMGCVREAKAAALAKVAEEAAKLSYAAGALRARVRD